MDKKEMTTISGKELIKFYKEVCESSNRIGMLNESLESFKAEPEDCKYKSKLNIGGER